MSLESNYLQEDSKVFILHAKPIITLKYQEANASMKKHKTVYYNAYGLYTLTPHLDPRLPATGPCPHVNHFFTQLF